MSSVKLNSLIENKAVKAQNIDIFHSISLLNIKNKVNSILNQIGKNEIFDEYTKHDITHVNAMLDLVNTVVESDTFEKLTYSECLMITLAIYFHDLGMLVTKKEYQNKETDSEFTDFRSSFKEEHPDLYESISCDKDKYLYQEYVRKNHAKRVKSWINEDHAILNKFDSNIIELIKEMLADIPSAFKVDLANICESHNLNDLMDESKYKPQQQYNQSKDTIVNLHYCSIVLRVCDLLNITNDRAPSFEMRLISPDNPVSSNEWLKHNSVNVIRPKKKRDKDGKIDRSLRSDTFEVLAYFKNEVGFFNLMSYLEYARREIQECFNQCEEINEKNDIEYLFPWKFIDDSSIETQGFDREQLLFTIDQTKILDLLIGHTLYNDSSVVLRELIQNSIDACRLKEFKLDKDSIYDGRIFVEVTEKNDEIKVTDNGIGMTLDIIKSHLLKVGSSRYQDPLFKETHKGFNSISRFGIGLLTCFMISDNIDILTKTSDSEEGLLIKIRKVHGKYLLKNIHKQKLPDSIKDSGTQITLKPRLDAREQCERLYESIQKWILIPQYSVKFIKGGQEQTIGFSDTAEYLKSVLTKIGIRLGDDIKVEKRYKEGVELSYVLAFNKFYEQWEFFQINRTEHYGFSGTCIEGIRVDSFSPGFEQSSIIAVANCTGEMAPKTNVARTNIENTENKDIFLTKVYQMLLEHISDEILQMCDKFSISWASREALVILDGLVSHGMRYNRNENTLINDELFYLELSKLKIILQEDHKERNLMSFQDLFNAKEFWTIDSESFRAADSLIQDASCKDKSTSSLLIMNNIHGGDDKAHTGHIQNLVCNMNNINENIITLNLRNKFNVSEIKTFTELRRVDLKWTLKKDELWKVISFRDDYDNNSSIYIQNSSDILVDLSSTGNAIRSSGYIFILENSELYDYLKTLEVIYLDEDNITSQQHFVLSILGQIISRIFYLPTINYEEIEKLISQCAYQSEREMRSQREELFEKYVCKEKLITSIVNTKFKNLDIKTWRRYYY
ncbi:HD domain-containing protein [Photobacterium damselae]|uniref:HD domain-containing protein n=1 Tax=Photobacterium damselae TaxID=38293 RepID=UPI004068F82C